MMKIINQNFLIKSLLLVLLFISLESGIAQEINWYSIDAGGGVSTGNDIVLTGVIGQQDTIQMSANEITVSGGYLPLPVNNDLIFKDSFEA